MKDALTLTIGQRLDDLLKQALGHVFFQFAAPANIIQQVTPCADLDDKEQVLVSLKVLVEAYDVFVLGSFEEHHFLHDLLLIAFVTESRLVDALDGAQALGQLVHCQVDLAKGTPTQDLAYAVEVDRRSRGFARLHKAHLNKLVELPNAFRSRCQVQRLDTLLSHEHLHWLVVQACQTSLQGVLGFKAVVLLVQAMDHGDALRLHVLCVLHGQCPVALVLDGACIVLIGDAADMELKQARLIRVDLDARW